MNLIFLGAPGAGKGTHSALVSKHLNIPTISTGDLLRAAIKEGSALGKEAEGYMKRGDLVPDQLVIDLMRERIAKSDCKDGFILDGFPRTVAQAQALEDLGIGIDAVVNIDVEDEQIVKRMSGRRVCNGCAATYHTIYKPSRTGEACENCGLTLVIREDDKPETVSARLQVYHEKTAPLIAYYEAKGNLQTVRGREELEETTKAVFEALSL